MFFGSLIRDQSVTILIIAALSLFNVAVDSKIYDKCELARELRDRHSIPYDQIGTFVCIAERQSSLNTQSVAQDVYFGLFQIGSEFWCNRDHNSYKACAISCSALQDDDLTDDVACVKTIYQEHERIFNNGFQAWPSGIDCQSQHGNRYVEECLTDQNEIVDPPPQQNSRILSAKTSSTSVGEGKVYERCELARELLHQHDMPMDQIATWVCIAKHESNFNTSAIGRLNWDGSEDHGLFQISDKFWCGEQGKACGVTCEEMRNNDITDDVECIQRIHKEHTRLSGDGFNAWAVYPRCKRQADAFMEGCFESENEVILPIRPVPGVQQHSSKNYAQPSRTRLSQDDAEVGKVYERCDLAQELRFRHKIPMEQVATWVCIAKHESNFNTSAIGRLNADGSEDHGLFQISDIYWCGDDTGKACGLSCEELRDNDISNDVRCMLQIYEEHERFAGDGFTAWAVYPRCKEQVESWIDGCFSEEYDFRPRPAITQPTSRSVSTSTQTIQTTTPTSTTARFDVKTIAQDFDEPIVYSTTEEITTTTTEEAPTTTRRRLPLSTTKQAPRTTQSTPTSTTQRAEVVSRKSSSSNNVVFNRINTNSNNDFKKTTIKSGMRTTTATESTVNNRVVDANEKRESDTARISAVTTKLPPSRSIAASTLRSMIDSSAKQRKSKSKPTLKPFNIFDFYLRDYTSRAPINYRPIQFSDRSTVIFKKKSDSSSAKSVAANRNNPHVTTKSNRVRQEIKHTSAATTTTDQLSFFDAYERLGSNENISNRIGRLAPRITPHSFEYLAKLTTPRTHAIYGVFGR